MKTEYTTIEALRINNQSLDSEREIWIWVR